MQAVRAETIVESLHAAGMTIVPTDDGRLKVTPASQLTPELCGLIRETKAELLRYFSVFAANDSVPKLPADPNAWRELAQAYYAHHLVCSTCRAAGRGSTYGLRCGVGATLWTKYQTLIKCRDTFTTTWRRTCSSVTKSKVPNLT